MLLGAERAGEGDKSESDGTKKDQEGGWIGKVGGRRAGLMKSVAGSVGRSGEAPTKEGRAGVHSSTGGRSRQGSQHTNDERVNH